MAPEQALGRGKEAGPAADIWALGAILYRLLTGQPPFLAATDFETIQQVIGSEPVPPRHLDPALPRDLETICLKCLRKEPGDRYRSADDLADDLRHWLADEPILARRAGRLERAVKWGRRHRGLMTAYTLAIVVVVAAVVMSLWPRQQPEQEAHREEVISPPDIEPPGRLEQLLLRHAPAVVQQLERRGHRNVGVLKFQVAKDGKWFSDNVGALNMELARRLEVALLLSSNPKKPLGIIRNASAVAARLPGANHLSRTGRLNLLDGRFPLAWGKAEVAPDAFVTGTAQVSKDLRTMKVSLLTFDRKENDLRALGEDFTVRLDAGLLGELDESFLLRGPPSDEQAVERAARVRDGVEPHPAVAKDVPILLEVFYDGRLIPVEIRQGRAVMPAPKAGQRVKLGLTRKDSSAQSFKVVLKVNGMNTVEKERHPDLECRGWIYHPADTGKRDLIEGFYVKRASALYPFRVAPAAESNPGTIDYGEHVGTIRMAVVRSRQNKGEIPRLSDEALRAAAVRSGRLPKDADSFQGLKSQVLEEVKRRLGSKKRAQDRPAKGIVRFQGDPVPVMSITVTYFQP
jgi:hypothetical protein